MIKGLKPQLSEAGKIKIGGLGAEKTSKKGGKYRLPVKLDHFVLTKVERDEQDGLIEDTDLMESLHDPDTGEVIHDVDKKLRRLPIVLHSNDIDEVFPTTYAAYVGKKLACRGDGETATRHKFKGNERTGETFETKCPCEYLEQGKCKAHGTLHCSIRSPGRAVAGAVHTWRTTSIISIQQMVGSLLQIQNVCGVLQGVPLWLVVRPVKVSPPGAPASTVYVCHIELRATDIAKTQQQLMEAARMRRSVAGEVGPSQPEYRAMIQAPAADDETDEEAVEVAAEFHPSPSNSVVDAKPKPSKKPEPPPPDDPGLKAGPHKSRAAEMKAAMSEDPASDFGPPPLTDEEAARIEGDLANDRKGDVAF